MDVENWVVKLAMVTRTKRREAFTESEDSKARTVTSCSQMTSSCNLSMSDWEIKLD